jgi:hypothetical protein
MICANKSPSDGLDSLPLTCAKAIVGAINPKRKTRTQPRNSLALHLLTGALGQFALLGEDTFAGLPHHLTH